MPDKPAILSEKQIPKILAQAEKYKEFAERAATPGDEKVIRWFAKTVRILCQTVRALRADVQSVQSGFDTYSQRVSTENAALRERLAQVRQELVKEKRLRSELKQIAQIGIAEVGSVGTVMKENAVTDFRARAINLCKEKAAEWAKDSDEALAADFDIAMSFTHMSNAANELRKALENLDHKGEKQLND